MRRFRSGATPPEVPLSRELHSGLIVRYFEEVWNQGRVGVLDELLHPDYVNHTPAQAGLPTGIGGLKRIVALLRADSSDMRVQVVDEIHDGDRVAVRCIHRGKLDGILFGIAPTGRRLEVEQVHILRFREGRILEHWWPIALATDDGAKEGSPDSEPLSVQGPPSSMGQHASESPYNLTKLLRQYLRGAFQSGAPEMRAAARQMGIGSRTLQRRLNQAGTTFSQEVDAARRELACQYVLEPDRPFREIAVRLGFVDIGSFFRAFRRWTQTSPRQFRMRSVPPAVAQDSELSPAS
ncbi:ester cyclase [Pendulispora rubella]|uniref:Ester cyclase n=1 Tax=Pendulispora rubella TaxID=2741070 RepID=A0ABZ2KSF9_9BACT